MRVLGIESSCDETADCHDGCPGDLSTDVAWLALPTLGGSWHNTHHAFPTTASNQLAWWQLDPCGWIIRAFAAVGLASDLKSPTRASIATKLIR